MPSSICTSPRASPCGMAPRPRRPSSRAPRPGAAGTGADRPGRSLRCGPVRRGVPGGRSAADPRGSTWPSNLRRPGVPGRGASPGSIRASLPADGNPLAPPVRGAGRRPTAAAGHPWPAGPAWLPAGLGWSGCAGWSPRPTCGASAALRSRPASCSRRTPARRAGPSPLVPLFPAPMSARRWPGAASTSPRPPWPRRSVLPDAVALEVVCHGGPEGTPTLGQAARMLGLARHTGVRVVLTGAVPPCRPGGRGRRRRPRRGPPAGPAALAACRPGQPGGLSRPDPGDARDRARRGDRRRPGISPGSGGRGRRPAGCSPRPCGWPWSASRTRPPTRHRLGPPPRARGPRYRSRRGPAGRPRRALPQGGRHPATRAQRPSWPPCRPASTRSSPSSPPLGYPTYFLTVAAVTDLIRDLGCRVAARGSGPGPWSTSSASPGRPDPVRPAHGAVLLPRCAPSCRISTSTWSRPGAPRST